MFDAFTDIYEIDYSVVEVYLDDNSKICQRVVDTFCNSQDAKTLLEICQELKPESKFVVRCS